MFKTEEKPIIIITGLAGSIGTALKGFLQDQYTIVGFDLKNTDCDIPIDLTSDDSVTLAFKFLRKNISLK